MTKKIKTKKTGMTSKPVRRKKPPSQKAIKRRAATIKRINAAIDKLARAANKKRLATLRKELAAAKEKGAYFTSKLVEMRKKQEDHKLGKISDHDAALRRQGDEALGRELMKRKAKREETELKLMTAPDVVDDGSIDWS
jgi:hypothetical protein